MRCPACQHEFEPDPLQTRLIEVRNRLIENAGCHIWALNGRHWYSFAPGQVIEITDVELKAVRSGATLETILEARCTTQKS
jgi:hypothetical protein